MRLRQQDFRRTARGRGAFRRRGLPTHRLKACATQGTQLLEGGENSGVQAQSVSLGMSYPLPITGRLTLTFNSSAVVPSDDPTVQFTSGGRSLDFMIPADKTDAVFPTALAGLQTGTVAGTITITSSLTIKIGESAIDITPSPLPHAQLW